MYEIRIHKNGHILSYKTNSAAKLAAWYERNTPKTKTKTKNQIVRKDGVVAQIVEQKTFNLFVARAIRASPTFRFFWTIKGCLVV